jgi:hypothetical protein
MKKKEEEEEETLQTYLRSSIYVVIMTNYLLLEQNCFDYVNEVMISTRSAQKYHHSFIDV